MENTFDADLALAQAAGEELNDDQPPRVRYDPSTNIFEQDTAVIRKGFNDSSGKYDDDSTKVQASGHEAVHGGIAIGGGVTSVSFIGDKMYYFPPSVEVSGEALRSVNDISFVNNESSGVGIWGEASNYFSPLSDGEPIAGGLYPPTAVGTAVTLENNTTINLTTGRLSTTYMTADNQIAELDAETGFPHGFTGKKSGCLSGPLPGASPPDSQGRFACPHAICNGTTVSTRSSWTRHQWRLHGLRKSLVITLKANPAALAIVKAIENGKLVEEYAEQSLRGENWNQLQGLM